MLMLPPSVRLWIATNSGTSASGLEIPLEPAITAVDPKQPTSADQVSNSEGGHLQIELLSVPRPHSAMALGEFEVHANRRPCSMQWSAKRRDSWR